MNRIITILVTIFILLLGYIWISHVWGTDKPRQPKDIVEANELDAGQDILTDVDTGYTAPMQDPMAEGESDAYQTERQPEPAADDAPESKPDPVVAEPVKPAATPEKKPAETKTEPAKPAESKPAPKTETKPVPAASSASSATGGKHMVIVGNFSQLANAEQRMQEVKKAGYPNAEVVRFDMSEYHTVCAGRYDDVNEARKVAKKLRDYNKIDAYVRIGG